MKVTDQLRSRRPYIGLDCSCIIGTIMDPHHATRLEPLECRSKYLSQHRPSYAPGQMVSSPELAVRPKPGQMKRFHMVQAPARVSPRAPYHRWFFFESQHVGHPALQGCTMHIRERICLGQQMKHRAAHPNCSAASGAIRTRFVLFAASLSPVQATM